MLIYIEAAFSIFGPRHENRLRAYKNFRTRQNAVGREWNLLMGIDLGDAVTAELTINLNQQRLKVRFPRRNS